MGMQQNQQKQIYENKVTVLWTRKEYNERTILNNKPDTVTRCIE